MIIIKHSEINQILALYNPEGVDVQLNKKSKSKQTKKDTYWIDKE